MTLHLLSNSNADRMVAITRDGILVSLCEDQNGFDAVDYAREACDNNKWLDDDDLSDWQAQQAGREHVTTLAAACDYYAATVIAEFSATDDRDTRLQTLIDAQVAISDEDATEQARSAGYEAGLADGLSHAKTSLGMLEAVWAVAGNTHHGGRLAWAAMVEHAEIVGIPDRPSLAWLGQMLAWFEDVWLINHSM